MKRNKTVKNTNCIFDFDNKDACNEVIIFALNFSTHFRLIECKLTFSGKILYVTHAEIVIFALNCSETTAVSC